MSKYNYNDKNKSIRYYSQHWGTDDLNNEHGPEKNVHL
jgi:hypothetical protein